MAFRPLFPDATYRRSPTSIPAPRACHLCKEPAAKYGDETYLNVFVQVRGHKIDTVYCTGCAGVVFDMLNDNGFLAAPTPREDCRQCGRHAGAAHLVDGLCQSCHWHLKARPLPTSVPGSGSKTSY